MDNALYFDRASLKNFKNIPSFAVEIAGRSIAIIGGNDQGKSSFLQALRSTIDSKFLPTVPITEGEERGELEIVVSGTLNGQPEKYKINTYFTPGNQRGSITIEDKDGNVTRKSARTMLDTLMGKISFNIDDFLRDSPAKQVKVLKELSGKGEEIDKISLKIDETKKKASYEKQKWEEQETLLKHHGFSQDEIQRYSKPEPIDLIEKELADIGPAMEKYTKVEAGITERKQQVKTLDDEQSRRMKESLENLEKITKMKEEIKKLEEINALYQEAAEKTALDRGALFNAIAKGEQWLKDTIKPDNTKIANKLSDAKAHNINYEKLEEFKKKQKSVMDGKDNYKNLALLVEKYEQERSHVIASSKLPIKGLTFTDDQIFYNGLPFEKGQINTATILEVGEEICMAHNPNLRVIFVPEGSLYDKPSLSRLVEKAHARGYRVVVEIVDPLGGDMQIKFIEEYLNG